MGVRPEPGKGLEVICEGFKCSDGYVVTQIVREHQFEALADLIGHPEWKTDARFETRAGWAPNLETVIRPAVDAWASQLTRAEAAAALTAVGSAAGPSNSAPDVIADPHVEARSMLVEVPRTDDVGDPVLVPGNPVKLSRVAEGPETRVPWVGEHTSDVLADELGLDEATLMKLREGRVIT
jgi:crotonobetainyl-CoA:carnitine CoA-transferase CaiB-like acyl-CoA transferase